MRRTNWFLSLAFVVGAAITGFGHEAEMIGLGVLLLGLLVYLMIPKGRL
jgi:hypothetical protein